MEAVDPLKATRRLQAQKNADKVRLQPYDYVDKSAAINNKKENFQLERNLQVMHKSGKISSENMVRDKKTFVEERRKNLRQVIPGLKSEFLKRSGRVTDGELIKIVQYFEEKNPSTVKHSHNDFHRSVPKKPKKLKPLAKPISISLQDLSAITRQDAKSKGKGSRSQSKLEIVTENLPVARFRYSTRDGHTETEKASLRVRDTGVITCPAFYLETGGRTSSLSRDSPFKAHSSLAFHTETDENGLPIGAAALLLGPSSRAESRFTARQDTSTPLVVGPDSRLSMHNDKVSREAIMNQTDGWMTTNTLVPPSPLKGFHPVREMDTSFTSSLSTDRSQSFKGGRKHLQSQGSENSYDTQTPYGSASSNATLNNVTSPHNRGTVQAESPKTRMHPMNNKKAMLPTGKPYHAKPQTEPSAGVTDILDQHLHPLQPVKTKTLPKIAQGSSAIAVSGEENGTKGEEVNPKRKGSPRKLFKNDKLVSTFLVPSDVKKLCTSPFDPYILALSQGEVSELGTKQREKDTENRLKIQKEFYKTAQGNVQHWISDVDTQMKKDRLKYITNFH